MPYYNPHKKITLFFLLINFILLCLVFIFFFTRAGKMIIVVTPTLEEKLLEKTLEIPKDLKGEILKITLNDEKTFYPKTISEIEGVAKGEVEIINNSNINQTLIKTTRLLSPEGVLFRLEERVIVPAKGKIKARVYADKPGKESEIEPTRFTLPGLPPYLQKLIYAESKEKMVGGVKRVGIVTEEDIEEAKKEFEETMSKKCDEEIQKKIKEMGIILTDSKIILADKKLEISTDAKPNEEREKFNLKGEINVVLIIFREKDFFDLIKKIAEKETPEDRKLKSIETASAKYEVKKIDLQNNSAELETKIKIYTTVKENSSIFDLEKIKKMKEEEVKKYLEQFKEIESVKIYFYPFWKRKLPEKNELIKIKIKEEYEKR